jgi:hypothetical protein
MRAEARAEEFQTTAPEKWELLISGVEQPAILDNISQEVAQGLAKRVNLHDELVEALKIGLDLLTELSKRDVFQGINGRPEVVAMLTAYARAELGMDGGDK